MKTEVCKIMVTPFGTSRLKTFVQVMLRPLLMLVTVTTTVTIATTVPPIDETEIPSPVILGGPAPLAPTGSAAIAYPATETDVITGTAAYSNLGYTETAVCYSIEAPIGRVVTVTNINNGRSITCTNVFSLLVPNGVTIILHTTVFIKLADLIDSPIPVKISW